MSTPGKSIFSTSLGQRPIVADGFKDLAHKAGIPPRLKVERSNELLLIYEPGGQAMTISTGMLELLNDQEVLAILADMMQYPASAAQKERRAMYAQGAAMFAFGAMALNESERHKHLTNQPMTRREMLKIGAMIGAVGGASMAGYEYSTPVMLPIDEDALTSANEKIKTRHKQKAAPSL